MPSAMVGSPICSSQPATSNCEVRITLCQQQPQTAVGSSQREIAEQRRRARVRRGISVPACLLRECASDETLAHAGL